MDFQGKIYHCPVLSLLRLMASSDSSSDTSTVSSSSSPSSSTKLSPSLSQYNFDPFAVHPFTSCASSNSNTPTMNYNRSNPPYAYPYKQSPGNYSTPHPPIPPPLLATDPIPSDQQLPQKPYTYAPPRPAGIFVPFRKETSSPDLPDILKSKPKSPPDTSKTRPATFLPVAPLIGLSSSRKH